MSAPGRFGTDGIRGRANRDITAPLALSLGAAVVSELGRRVAVAHDGRPSAPMLEAAVVAGVASLGGDPVRMGLLPTPALSWLVAREGFSAGIMLTASHNRAGDNGIKILDGRGEKPGNDLRARLESALVGGFALAGFRFRESCGRPVEDPGASERYVALLVEAFDAGGTRPLRGRRAVVDAANGAAFRVAPEVLRRLGAEVEVLGEGDGAHINEGCGALHPEGLAARVVATGADFGLALDGDGDRVVLVDGQGGRYDGDALLWLASAALPRGSSVVGTVMTNAGLEAALVTRGLSLVRAAVGDHAVLEAMRRASLPLGGEPSGHVLWGGGPPTSDGLYTALRIVLPDPRSLPARLVGYRPHYQAHRTVPLGAGGMPTLPTELLYAAEARGARVVIRVSGTEPVLRLLVEHPEEEVATVAVESLLAVLGR